MERFHRKTTTGRETTDDEDEVRVNDVCEDVGSWMLTDSLIVSWWPYRLPSSSYQIVSWIHCLLIRIRWINLTPQSSQRESPSIRRYINPREIPLLRLHTDCPTKQKAISLISPSSGIMTSHLAIDILEMGLKSVLSCSNWRKESPGGAAGRWPVFW